MKGRVRKLLLSLAVAAGFLVVTELAYRVQRFGAAGLSYSAMNSVCPLGEAGIVQNSEHPGLLYELIPNQSTWFKLARFETNALGMRDRHYELDKPASTSRVAVVGDSFTMGSGVEVDEVWHSRLEARLPDMQFLNFGVAGYGPSDYLEVLREKAAGLDPDLVLVALTFNDVHRPLIRNHRGEYKVKPRARPFFRLSLVEALLARIRKRAAPDEEELRAARADNLDVSKPRRSPTSPENRAFLSEVFAELRAIGAEWQVPVVLLYLRKDRSAARDRVGALYSELAREAGIPYRDLVAPFEGIPPEELRIYPGDSHPNSRANALFADATEKVMAQLGLL